MRHTLLLIGFLILGTLSYAQNLSGNVLDQTSHFPIANVKVLISNQYSSITNSEGQFALNSPQTSAQDSISFSSLGYHTKTLALADYSNDTVYLMPIREQQLAQVVLLDEELSALEVMQRVKAHLSTNYNYQNLKFRVFHRSETEFKPQKLFVKIKKATFLSKSILKNFNHKMDSINEHLKGKSMHYYTADLADISIGKVDSIHSDVIKATKLINDSKTTSTNQVICEVINALSASLKTSSTFKVRTGIIPVGDSVNLAEDFAIDNEAEIDSVYNKNLAQNIQGQLNQLSFGTANNSVEISIGGTSTGSFIGNYITDLDEYNYTIEKLSVFNNQPVYVITFTPDDGFLSSGGRFSGKLYISSEDYAVLRADYQLGENKHGKKLNLKFLLGIKYVENAKSGTVIFSKTKNGTYFPSYLELSGNQYAYFSRSFVFKENAERKERMKLKLKFTLEFNNVSKNQWVFSSIAPQDLDTHKNLEEKRGIPVQDIKRYDPKIWDGYNILLPTEAIREYE